MTRVAGLDDYQGRAAGYADWDSLGPEVEVQFFAEPIEAGELPARLGRRSAWPGSATWAPR